MDSALDTEPKKVEEKNFPLPYKVIQWVSARVQT